MKKRDQAPKALNEAPKAPRVRCRRHRGGRGLGRGFPPPRRLGGLGERCELPQRGPGQSPGRLENLVHSRPLGKHMVALIWQIMNMQLMDQKWVKTQQNCSDLLQKHTRRLYWKCAVLKSKRGSVCTPAFILNISLNNIIPDGNWIPCSFQALSLSLSKTLFLYIQKQNHITEQ